jgi:hypothetical protein
MSWWTDIRDAAETFATGGAALEFNESARNKAEGAFNKITGRPSAADKRNQDNMIGDQIKAYRDQTELAQKELTDLNAQKDVQRRLIQEKQIRSLRGSYRPAGFLNNQAPQNNTVGSTPGLQSKLGNA